jgi:hypothetical protein
MFFVMPTNISKLNHICSGNASFPSAIYQLLNLGNQWACPEVKTGCASEIAVNKQRVTQTTTAPKKEDVMRITSNQKFEDEWRYVGNVAST